MTRTLRAAVIGLGVGRQHLAAYRQLPDVEPVLICDIDETRLSVVAAEYGGIAMTSDWRDIARDKSIDLVSVCTPDGQHFQQALAMALSGKHVLCEKPMVTGLDQAKTLMRTVKEKGITLAVGNVNRFVPQFGLAARYAHSGRLGELFFVEANYIHDMRPVFKQTPWRIDPEQPQNAIFGGGVHPVDLAQWVAGEVEEVFAYGNHKTVPEYRSADNILITLKFKSGCVGKVWITFGIRRRPEHVVDLNLFGSEGTIYTNSEQAEARLYIPELTLSEQEEQSGWMTVPFDPVKGHPFLAELAAFVEAIRTGQNPMVGVEDGARTVAVLEAAQRSSESGQPVPVEDIHRPLAAGEQLLMRRPHLAGLADELALPEGYEWRTYRPGDEQAWLELCNPAIGMGWSVEQLHQKLLDVPWFSPERLFFVTHNGEPVGTACAWQLTAEEKNTGYVHMVAVKPEHRGRGLGWAATLRVLHYFQAHGFKTSVLNTDDFRLPAIGVYRSLGFQPVIQDEVMRQRWEAIEAVLGGVK